MTIAIDIILSVLIGGVYILLCRREFSKLKSEIIGAETTPIPSVVEVLNDMQTGLSDARGYFEIKGRIYAKEAISTPVTHTPCIIARTQGDNLPSIQAPNLTRRIYPSYSRGINFYGFGNILSSSSGSSSKGSKSKGSLGAITLIILAIGGVIALLKWKHEMGKEYSAKVGQLDYSNEIVICDASQQHLIRVDVDSLTHLLFSNSKKSGQTTEHFITNGAAVYAIGEFYMQDGQVCLGASSESTRPFVLSTKSEKAVIESMKNMLWVNIGFGAGISVAVFMVLYALQIMI